MATYRYRCDLHGDFMVRESMEHTQPLARCPHQHFEHRDPHPLCPKVLGNPNAFQFTYGKAEFHDGPDGTGETVRETADRWERQARAAGLEPERVGYRHI